MSLVLTRKFQTDWFSIPDLREAEAAERLGINNLSLVRLSTRDSILGLTLISKQG